MSPSIPDIGETAPDFHLPDSDGAIFSLHAALERTDWGVLVFYRGHW